MKNYLLALVAFALFLPLATTAQEELCAEVKIEIKQELTFERQGFEDLMQKKGDRFIFHGESG